MSEQHKYNLLCREPELEVLPAAQHLGIGVIAWAPLEAGILAGKALTNPGTCTAPQKEKIEKHRRQLEEFAKLCRELGESESTVALAWVLAHPAITAPIIGPRTVEQLESCLRALEVKLDEEVMERLNEIFPGPGKPAPEAYSW